MSVVSVRLFVR